MSTSCLNASSKQIVHLAQAGYASSEELRNTPKLIGQLILNSPKSIGEFGDAVREAMMAAVGVAMSTVDLADLQTTIPRRYVDGGKYTCRLLPIKMSHERVPVLTYNGRTYPLSWWFAEESPHLELDDQGIRCKKWPRTDQHQKWQIAGALAVVQFIAQHIELVKFLGGIVGYCRDNEGINNPKGSFMWREWGGTTVHGPFEGVTRYYSLRTGPVLGWLLIMHQ